MVPLQSETPKMAKIKKKNTARTITPPNYATLASRVAMRSLMLGMVVSERNGRIRRGVLMLEIDLSCGISVNNELMTTMKSSQFQESSR